MASSTSVYSLILQAIHENSLSKFKDVVNKHGQVELLMALCLSNEQGETPLVVAMKKKHFNIIDEMILTIFFSHDESKSDGNPNPLCSAAIALLFSHQIPIVELIDYLITEFAEFSWLELVLSGLRSSTRPRQEKIIALELIGASFILLREEEVNMYGIECWKEAIALCYSPADGESPIPKISAFNQTAISHNIFGTVVEVMSMQQLEQLKQQLIQAFRGTWEDWSLINEALKIQALLVNRRIVRQVNPGQPVLYYFHLKSLIRYGQHLESRHDLNRAINTYHLALEEMTVIDPKTVSTRLVAAYDDTLCYMLNCYKEILKQPIDSSEREELSSDNLFAAIKFCTTVAKFFLKPDPDDYGYDNSFDFPKLTYEFVMMLYDIYPQMNDQEKQQLGKYLFFYNSSVVQNDAILTDYPLHVAVLEQYDLKYIHLLLQFGADPNAMNSRGETPLHILAHFWDFCYSEMDSYFSDVYRVLMNAGGHLDLASLDGKTVISILKESEGRCGTTSDSVDSIINTIFPLSCYCARVIRQYNIPFEDQLPVHLLDFVRLHSDKGL